MSVSINIQKAVFSAIPEIPTYLSQDSIGNLSALETQATKISRIKSKIRNTSASAANNNSVTNTPWFKPPAWQASTAYFDGQVVVGLDGVNTYICRDGGTSAGSGGPTGTGYAIISDGSVNWYWKGKVRGLGNATSVVTANTVSTLLTSIPNARSFIPSLTQQIGYWAGGVVEYDSQGSGDVVNVKGSNLNSFASPQYNSPPGASFTFITDSTKVILASYNAVYAGAKFVVEINDRLIDDSTFVNLVQYNPGGYMIDLTNIPGAIGNFNKIKISSFGGYFLLARTIYIEPGASIYAPQNSNRWTMAVEGDSLTAGGNNTPYHTGLDWVSQVGAMIGCDSACNMAQGGTGFISNRTNLGTTYVQRLSRLASINADVYLIAGNHNDNTYPQADQIAAALTYFRQLRALQPNSLIIVCGNTPLQPESSTSGLVYNAELNLKTAFDQFADANSIWIPICTDPNGPWITGTGYTTSPANDGNKDRLYINPASDQHPIQRGVDYFAQRYYHALKNAIV